MARNIFETFHSTDINTPVIMQSISARNISYASLVSILVLRFDWFQFVTNLIQLDLTYPGTAYKVFCFCFQQRAKYKIGSCIVWGASADTLVDTSVDILIDISVDTRFMSPPSICQVSTNSRLPAHPIALMVSVDVSTAILSVVYWSTIGYILVDCRS